VGFLVDFFLGFVSDQVDVEEFLGGFILECDVYVVEVFHLVRLDFAVQFGWKLHEELRIAETIAFAVPLQGALLKLHHSISFPAKRL
jgi:hypothetical protein